MIRSLALALAFALAARADSAPAATGTVSGRISIAGLSPKLPPLPVTKDNKICGVNRADEALITSVAGGIKNAVLWLPDLPAPKAGDEHVRLDQQGCRFEPHVVVAHPGATLEVTNSEVVLHHPTAKREGEKLWDFPMPIKGYSVPRTLDKAGTINITCEAHPWMKATVLVLEAGPASVSDDDGKYTIANVPAGKHKLKLWHERLGEREEEIEVKAGETATRDITLSPR